MPLCEDGHALSVYRPPSDGFCCELCGEDLEEAVQCWRCQECGGLTFCLACVGGGEEMLEGEQLDAIPVEHGENHVAEVAYSGREQFSSGPAASDKALDEEVRRFIQQADLARPVSTSDLLKPQPSIFGGVSEPSGFNVLQDSLKEMMEKNMAAARCNLPSAVFDDDSDGDTDVAPVPSAAWTETKCAEAWLQEYAPPAEQSSAAK